MKVIVFKDKEYHWSAFQDSEHPDVIFRTQNGEIWVQFEIGIHDREHNNRYQKGQEKYPVSDASVNKLLVELINKGYMESYHASECGLIFTEKMKLIEN